MNASIDLKNLERKAWTSYFSDGLLDIYLGLLLFSIAMMETGMGGIENRWLRYLVYLGLILVSWFIFWLGRRFITIPRLGRVKFGSGRQVRKSRMVLLLVLLVAINILLVVLTMLANRYPDTWGRWMPRGLAMQLFICIFVGGAMALVAYYKDFRRGYYIAVIYALTFLASELLELPWAFWVGGALVFIPGLVLFTLFLKNHPLSRTEEARGQTTKG